MSTELLSSPVPRERGGPAWPPPPEIPDNITCGIHSVLSRAPIEEMLSTNQGTGTTVFSFLIPEQEASYSARDPHHHFVTCEVLLGALSRVGASGDGALQRAMLTLL